MKREKTRVRQKKYGVIYADPPWHWRAYSNRGEGRSAKNHYGIMSLSDLKNMRPTILAHAKKDCALFLWAIDPMLPDALRLIEAWGFTFKTVAFYWVKVNKRSPTPFVGLGYWTRANPEMCLLATRGNPKRLSRSVRRLVVSPVREHSRKPDQIRDDIRRLVGGPYLEMFARTKSRGWDVRGNQTGKFA